MTPEFLQLLVKRFPNSYELGETVRKFHFFYNEKETLMNLFEIENEFIKIYIDKGIDFQKVG
jgi:hypothetical protein